LTQNKSFSLRSDVRSDINDVPSSKSSLVSEVSNQKKSNLKKSSVDNEQSRISENLIGKENKKKSLENTKNSDESMNPGLGKKISWSDLVEKDRVSSFLILENR
jgi:hypothetical protein